MQEIVGQSLGRYKVVNRLDKGAMGEVYKGYHTSLNRNVAIKVLHSHLASSADFVERFEQEAAIVARLRHTNIVQVFDFDVVDGMYYMVMEFIDGPSLRDEYNERYSGGRPYTPFEIGYIAQALGSALDYAHVRGVIHRDIKPANIMFNSEGQVVLADFGIVHILGDEQRTRTGQVIGTPAFMAPEQGSGEKVSAATDVYAMGVVLYQLFTGRLPFTAENALQLVLKHMQEPVLPPRQINPAIPLELENALLKSLEKEPARRYQKASQFAQDVRRAVGMTAEQALRSVSITSVPEPADTEVITAPADETAGSDVTILAGAGSVGGRTVSADLPTPYRGLFAFREEDARFFFGREEFTERLAELTKSQPMVAVIGPSGSGKSSVVYAGLLPYLHQGDGWTSVDFRPGNHPFQALAGALVPLLQPSIADSERARAVQQLAEQMQQGVRPVHEVLRRAADSQPTGTRLLLIADQFEELFTLGHAQPVREQFLDALVEAVDIQKFHRQQAFCLVLTLRADFLAQALAHRPFAAALQEADVKLGPMSRQDLSRAISNPAKRLGVAFEPGLVQRIIEDVGEEPGNLPLLEFALTALWEQRQGRVMTHDAYERIGGVAGALARHANEVYGRLTEGEQRAARRALVQMVQPGIGTEDTRRVATRNEFPPETWPLVQRLADERLVVTGVNDAGQETAEVVHEALIRSWAKLRQWMESDRSFRAWQERLRAAMNQWESSNRDEGALLRGVPLQQALEWSDSETVILTADEVQYIRLSQEAADRTRREKEEQQRRELEQAQALSESRKRQVRVVRAASIALGVLLLVAICGAAFAFFQRSLAQENAQEAALQATAAFVARETAVANEQVAATRAVEADTARVAAEDARSAAESARDDAERERLEALRQSRLSLAQSLVSLSLATNERENDSELAALLAIEAARFNDQEDGDIGWYVDSALRPVVSAPFFNRTVAGHTGGVRDVVFSPDGQMLASGATDNSVRLWQLERPLVEPAILVAHSAPVTTVAFASEGERLASGDENGTILIWNTQDTDQEPLALDGHDDALLALVFLPNGNLISSGLDGNVLSWDAGGLDAGATVLVEGDRPVLGIAVSPEGDQLALAGDDRTVQLYNLTDGSTTTLGEHDSSVISVAFSPDGSAVASTSVDGTVRVWPVASPDEVVIFRGHESRVRDVVFLPDGRRLVSASDDNTLRVWDLDRPDAPGQILAGHELRVRALDLSPDGSLLASGSDDTTIRLWQVDAPATADRALTGHGADVLALTFTPAGDLMFTSGADNNVRIWETENFTEQAVLEGHEGRVRALAVDPDARLLASGSDDATIRVWDLADPATDPTVLSAHEGAVRAVAFSEDGSTLYSAGDDGLIRAWNVADLAAQPAILVTQDSEIFALALSPAGDALASGNAGAVVTVIRLDDPGAEPLTLAGHAARVSGVEFTPDGERLVSASEDGTARVWDLSDAEADPQVLIGHQAGVRGLAISPDGRQLVTTSQDQTVRVWDLNALLSPPAVLTGHAATVIDAAFVPGQSLFATVSDDDTVRLWRPLEDLVELGCERVQRNLTPAEWAALVSESEPYRATCPNLPLANQ